MPFSPRGTGRSGLSGGAATAMRDLRSALAVYHQMAIRPYLDDIQAAVGTDSAHRAQAYLRHGPEAALFQLAPFATWKRPVLSFGYPVERDLHLAGRGLVLIPSYFCLHHPVALADPSLRPTLVYPIATATRLLTIENRRGDRLSAVLGHTRSAILRATIDPRTTSALARRIGVTAATVSHHTTVLRESGLITTYRDGSSATHTITPLGLALVAHNE